MQKRFLATCFLCIITGCVYSEYLDENEVLTKGDAGLSGVTELVLGEELPNPYSRKAMLDALEKLTPGESLGVTPAMLNATHYLVKFNPRSTEEVDALNANPAFPVRNWPYNRKIVKDGDVYTPPTTSGIPSLYATIPVGVAIPDIPYEIIDSIIYMEEPDGSSGPVGPSGSNGLTYAQWQRLEGKSNRLLGLTDANTGQEGPAAKYTPTGSISVYDEVLGKNVGLEGVLVHTYRQVLFVTCNSSRSYTQADGTFRMERDYKYKVTYRFYFENPRLYLNYASGCFWTAASPAKSCNIVFKKNRWEVEHAFLWRAGTTLTNLPTNKYIKTSDRRGFFMIHSSKDWGNLTHKELMNACNKQVVSSYGRDFPFRTGIDKKIKESFLHAVAYEMLWYNYTDIKNISPAIMPGGSVIYIQTPDQYNGQGWTKNLGDTYVTPIFIDMEDHIIQHDMHFYLGAQAQNYPDDRIYGYNFGMYIDWMPAITTESDLRQHLINNRRSSFSISDIDLFLSQYR